MNTLDPLKRQKQTFTQSHCSQNSESQLCTNDRVVISKLDGSRWAITMGVILKPMCNGEVEVLVDKAVPSGPLYRIDAAPSFGGGIAAGILADFCTSDSERYSYYILSKSFIITLLLLLL